MEFFIKKNATLPVLKINVIKDGRSDYDRSMRFLDETDIFFSMVDTKTGIPRITSRPAGLMKKESLDPNSDTEYYVYYQFTPFDTKKVARYKGQFLFRNETGIMTLPLNQDIFINVTDSFIIDDSEYQSCYIVDYPCCFGGIIPPPIPPIPVTTTTTFIPLTTTTTYIPLTTTTTIHPVTTSTTTLSGVTSWTITRGVGDIDFFCDGDLTMFTVLYTNAMNELTPGVRLYAFPNLVGYPIFMNHQSFYTVFERNGIPLVDRYSINPIGGLSFEDGPRYVGNVHYCGDPIPCRQLTYTKIINNTTPIMFYNCNGTYQTQLINFGQTITVCGSYPIYQSVFTISIGNNC